MWYLWGALIALVVMVVAWWVGDDSAKKAIKDLIAVEGKEAWPTERVKEMVVEYNTLNHFLKNFDTHTVFMLGTYKVPAWVNVALLWPYALWLAGAPKVVSLWNSSRVKAEDWWTREIEAAVTPAPKPVEESPEPVVDPVVAAAATGAVDPVAVAVAAAATTAETSAP